MTYPLPVERLQRAFAGLPDVSEVRSSVVSLDGANAEVLHLPMFAELPHGALRRTDGGLPGEALIQIEFVLGQTAQGWRTLEFIAWFVRDQARGGEAIQLRPFALPPTLGAVAGELENVVVQIGHTLRWQVDLFCIQASQGLASELTRVNSVATGLESAMEFYGPVLLDAHTAS